MHAQDQRLAPAVAWFQADHLLRTMETSTPDAAPLDQVRRRRDSVAAANAENAFAQRLRAREADLRGDRAAMLNALERAWRLDHRRPEVAIELARLHRALGDPARGCEVAARVRHRLHISDGQRAKVEELTRACATTTRPGTRS